jgi:hypothetical protein
MTNRPTLALYLLATFTASALLWAKGDMVVIEIKGGALTSPIKIADPKIQEFNVGAGPGVNGTTLGNAGGSSSIGRQGSSHIRRLAFNTTKSHFMQAAARFQTILVASP